MKKLFIFLILLSIPLFAQRWTSTINSTKVLLAGNATFTGTAEKANNFNNAYAYNWINITIKSAQSGAGKVYQSKDGTTWDHATAFTYTGGDTLTNLTSVPIILDYFKVTYTNGSVAQTTFRLTTVLTNEIMPLDASGNVRTNTTVTFTGGATSAGQAKAYSLDSLINTKSFWTTFSNLANQKLLYSLDSLIQINTKKWADSIALMRQMLNNQTNGNQLVQQKGSPNHYGTIFTTAGTNPDSISFAFTTRSITFINDGVSTDTLFVSSSKTFPTTNRDARTGGEGLTKSWALTKVYFKVGTTPLASKKIRVEAL